MVKRHLDTALPDLDPFIGKGIIPFLQAMKKTPARSREKNYSNTEDKKEHPQEFFPECHEKKSGSNKAEHCSP